MRKRSVSASVAVSRTVPVSPACWPLLRKMPCARSSMSAANSSTAAPSAVSA